MNELKPAKLRVGMFVTVIHGPSYGDGNDMSYTDDVLEIKAINTPRVILHNHTGCGRRIHLDTNKWKLGALTKDFVKAALDKCGCGKSK